MGEFVFSSVSMPEKGRYRLTKVPALSWRL
jgi:hypothetical protein